MNVNEQIIKILDELGESFGIAVDWSNKNVLLYIKEIGDKIVRYDLGKSIFQLIFSLILSVSIVILFQKIYRTIKTEKKTILMDYGSPSLLCAILVIVMIIIFILLLASIFDSICWIYQDIVFPEKTIIEFVQKYLNK